LAFCCCLLLVGAIIWAGYLSRARKRGEDDWEIRYDELEVGAHLGTGGFGEVYRATWKGTEVAVKVMLAERVTKDMARRFKDEVLPKSSAVCIPSCLFGIQCVRHR
jgi:hypothetical protein